MVVFMRDYILLSSYGFTEVIVCKIKHEVNAGRPRCRVR